MSDPEKETRSGIAGFFSRLQVGALLRAVGDFFSNIGKRVGSIPIIDNVRARFKDSVVAKAAGLGIVIFILLIVLIALIAGLAARNDAASMAGGQEMQDTYRSGDTSPASGASRSSAGDEAELSGSRNPWLETPLLPDEPGFFLTGEWQVDRERQDFWTFADTVPHWYDLKALYKKALRQHNSRALMRFIEEDR